MARTITVLRDIVMIKINVNLPSFCMMTRTVNLQDVHIYRKYQCHNLGRILPKQPQVKPELTQLNSFVKKQDWDTA